MGKNDDLINKTDKAINDLVFDKKELLKAYNYYNGIRDAELYRYLEEVYGTDTPTALHFTPMIRKHVDCLIGEYLGTPIIPKIFCKDSDTISNIDRDKQLKIAETMHEFLKANLEETLLSFKEGKQANNANIKKLLEEIAKSVENNFVSEYEAAALNVLQYIMLSRDTDITTALRDILLDLLVTGYTFFKVEPTVGNTNIKIRVLNPLNTFIDRNLDSPYVKDSYRVVVRTWMTKILVLNKYGKELNANDRKLLDEKWDSVCDNASYYIRLPNIDGLPVTNGLDAGHEVTPGYPDPDNMRLHEYIPVYEVEWLETDKNFVMLRYQTIRIGDEIYILKGLDKNVIRQRNNPNYCSLSVNGVYFLNRGNKPWSLVNACSTMQDQLDLLIFYRDNIIASSGTVGDWIDLPMIPEKLGVSLPERLLKWIAYKKLGIAILDSSQEGKSGNPPINTIFNGFDDTVKTNAIQAIDIAIQSVLKSMSDITGITDARVGEIEERAAVLNVKLSTTKSYIITKQYYHIMDLIVNEMLLDCLNLAKSVYKNGLLGTIILGDKYQKVFTAYPENFTITDFDIRIITSSEVVEDTDALKAVLPSLIQAQALSPHMLMEAVTCRNLPELKLKVEKDMEEKKKENDLIAKLTQLNTELQLLLQKAGQLLEQLQAELLGINKEKLKLEEKKLLEEMKLKWYQAKTDREFKQSKEDELKTRTKIEVSLLVDRNNYNDKIRSIEGWS